MYSSESINIYAHILNKLTSKLPSFSAQPQDWPHLSSLQLADPDFLTPRLVDIILGADHYGLVIKPDIVKHNSSSPIAQSTIFGWIVIGPISESEMPSFHSYHTAVEASNQELQELLTKFWIQEEIPIPDQQLTPEEQACENHFNSTHSRDEQGRYIVRIPLNASPSILGESQLTAERCLIRLINKLNSNEAYKNMYTNFMKEYEELNHMRPVRTQKKATQQSECVSGDLPDEMTLAHDVSASGGLRVSEGRLLEHAQTYSHYYLPHHGVLREDHETTKLRVVFNGSCATSSGISLNDIQHVGPKVQKDIADVLIWMRKYKYLFTADITKMYRQIKVHEEDWDLQRIMWVDDQLNMIPYHLTTVTYGTRSAPYLAIRTLLQLIQDEGHRFPLAIEPLINARYVDDIFGGSDQLTELIEISNQVTQLCMAGGFPLAKWHSNNRLFLRHVSQLFSTQESHTFEDSSTKLLGLSWIPSSDSFKFCSRPSSSSSKLTKRTILSETKKCCVMHC